MGNNERKAIITQMNDILCSIGEDLIPKTINSFVLHHYFEVKPCVRSGIPMILIRICIDAVPSFEIVETVGKEKVTYGYDEIWYQDEFDDGRRKYFESSFRETIGNMVLKIVTETNKRITVFRKEEQ